MFQCKDCDAHSHELQSRKSLSDEDWSCIKEFLSQRNVAQQVLAMFFLFCQICEDLQCEFTFRSKDNWGSPFVPSFWRTFPTLLPAAATSVSTTASHISKTENQRLRLSQSKRDTEKSTSDQNQAWQNPLTCNSRKFVKIWVLTTSFTSWLFSHARI